MNKMSNDEKDIAERYRCAEKWMLRQYQPMDDVALNATVYPHWIGQSDLFWYQRQTRNGKEFRLVDARAGRNEVAFDHQALGQSLGNVIGQTVNGQDLPLSDVEIRLQPKQVQFSAFEKRWIFDEKTGQCEENKLRVREGKVSPDGKSAVYYKDYNLWLRDLQTGKERRLTQDGERHYCYAVTHSIYGRQEALTLEAVWSPDSRKLLTIIRDTREVPAGPPLVRHVPPPEAGLRPDIIDEDRRVAWYGDEHVEQQHFVVIEVDTGQLVTADYPPCVTFFQHYWGIFTSGKAWWSPDSRRAYFVEQTRDGRTGRLVELDTGTGATRVLIEEESDAWFKFIPIAHLGVMLKPLPGGRELIWYSEISGWGHLYLYDLETGRLKNPITQGAWTVRNVLHWDPQERELIIMTAGRAAGRNPYYRDICRVNVDTGELTEVISTDHEYFTCDPVVRGCAGLNGVSDSGRYLVTTRSRIDQVPVSLLLDRNGAEIMTLEAADVSGLPEGWQWPEPVMVKAADGKTDIYSSIFRPSDFSADKSYPVLDFCSFMTHSPIGAFANNYVGSWSYACSAAYAELGFIVVNTITRGTDLRGRSFENDKEVPLGYCFNQQDAIAAIRQLAERYPYMDLNRVGLGGSYGNPPAALNGMLRYPDFYKVGVSGGNAASDTRLIGDCVARYFASGRTWLEDLREFHLEHQAKNLKGKLLIIAGMLDNTVPVASAFRIIEALQKANKTFDMLILPNFGHGICRYEIRRTWDYLIEHLKGEKPPKEYELSPLLDLDDSTQYLYRQIHAGTRG